MILRKVKINGYCIYWGQEWMRLGLLWYFCILAVFCLLVWVVMWMYFYYSLQPYTYFRYLYISQLKRKQKSLKHLTAIDYSVTQYYVKTNWWFAGNLSASHQTVFRFLLFVLHGGFGIDCSSAVSIMQGWSGSVGGVKRSCRDHQKTDFQMDLGLDFDFIPLMALLHSQFFSC